MANAPAADVPPDRALEIARGFGAAFVAGPDKLVVGTTLTINHLRAVREGNVTAIGVPLHSGRTSAVWDMRVTDDSDRLVAGSRLALAIRDPGQLGAREGVL